MCFLRLWEVVNKNHSWRHILTLCIFLQLLESLQRGAERRSGRRTHRDPSEYEIIRTSTSSTAGPRGRARAFERVHVRSLHRALRWLSVRGTSVKRSSVRFEEAQRVKEIKKLSRRRSKKTGRLDIHHTRCLLFSARIHRTQGDAAS